jgi:ribosomal protein S18 acetylase RimI-like enzyme
MVAMHGVGVDQLGETVGVLSEWQRDGAAVQLHPGDLGWQWRFGAAATAAALRTWSRDGQTLAMGMLDVPGLLRLAIAPENHDDEELARQMVTDVSEPGRDVLPRGKASVEARFDSPFRALLVDEGWVAGELWTQLQRDLAVPVEDCGMRVEVIGPERAGVRAAVQRAAFDRSMFTDARWLAMASGLPYADARCLVGYDGKTAVAVATAWSSGPGRPGLLEPVGVHRDHRGRGCGTAITLAAATALREMGSSSASVCTRSLNVAAVATYRSAGFYQLPEVADLSRSTEEGGP